MTLRYSHPTPDVKRQSVQLLDRTEEPGDRETMEDARGPKTKPPGGGITGGSF
jgi:hypothetical protein